ncbi:MULTISPECIES: hypothetical protein [Asticcacaulis]|uniref:hypothetical protein n=1 Tax=Asticcacaulis TaxID=76890 RepID=UPI001AE3BE75|nr:MULTISPECIES: hypothetical protein [Asticcacaulis]MBP2158191.1 hypothetical protein [Asticcacaulis solisilvae]MDR6799236.1 hypothetical protein [Asticcacaulis sp. BE141]
MTAVFQRHPLALVFMAVTAMAVVYPFRMEGGTYEVLFGLVVLLWLGLVAISFRAKTWKGAVALGVPVALVIPYFAVLISVSCFFFELCVS